MKKDLLLTRVILNINDCSVDINATEMFYIKYIEPLETSKNINTVKHKISKKIKPWITNSLIRSIKNKEKLKNNTVTQKKRYKKYRSMLNKLISKTKNYYYKNEISKNKNNEKIYTC